MKTFYITLIGLVFGATSLLAGDFTVKIDIKTVDHASTVGTVVTVYEKGQPVETHTITEDGEQVKLSLTKGKLYEIWISKGGYISHVIHNVHKEGSSRFDVTLFSTEEKMPTAEYPDYTNANRTFDKIKKMTIPAEFLGDSLKVFKKSELPEAEKKALKHICKMAKRQVKSQRKIDRYTKKRDKYKEKINEMESRIEAGEVAAEKGEEKILKWQKKVVRYQGKIGKLHY
ncbi:MAG: hypothetical protein Kow0075_00520 [Salibacteraceae bacterium]